MDNPATPPSASLLVRVLRAPLTPIVAGGIIIIGGALLLMADSAHEFGLPTMGASVFASRPDVVVFDPVRFLNAQRAAASILASAPNADLALTMTQVAKQAEEVILEEARGSVVLVKQAVVVPEGIPDITDAVLSRFGLPTTVPTVSISPNSAAMEAIAPTDQGFSRAQQEEDARMAEKQQQDTVLEALQRNKSQADVLP